MQLETTQIDRANLLRSVREEASGVGIDLLRAVFRDMDKLESEVDLLEDVSCKQETALLEIGRHVKPMEHIIGAFISECLCDSFTACASECSKIAREATGHLIEGESPPTHKVREDIRKREEAKDA